jgi:hypothetical protein
MSHLIFLRSLSAGSRTASAKDALFPGHLFMKDIVRESIHENAPPSKSHWFLLTLLCIFYKRQHVFCALPDIWKAAYWGAPMLIAWMNIYGCGGKDGLCTLPH